MPDCSNGRTEIEVPFLQSSLNKSVVYCRQYRGLVLMFFQYGDRERSCLAAKDKGLDQAIQQIGHIDREVDSELFSAIVHPVIGQQR